MTFSTKVEPIATKTQAKTFISGPWANLIFNVALPVFLLKNVGQWFPALTPLSILMISIAPPLVMGVKELIDAHTLNIYSLLGLVNIGLTGGFAVLQLSGGWFIVKEASLPFALGVACWISSFSAKPVLSLLLFNDQLLNRDVIDARLGQLDKVSEWRQKLKVGTQLFAGSFMLSAILNAAVAYYTFSTIDQKLEPSEQARLLNEQIAQMTWLGFVIVALPCLIVSGLSLYWVLNRLSHLTGWTLEELMGSRDQVPVGKV